MTDFAKLARSRLHRLPPISTTTLKLIELLGNDDYQTGDLVPLIETDVSLAARCLTTVNAPVFGLKRSIASVQHAVTLLGARAVLDLALQLSVRGTYNKALTGYASSPDDLYKHSLYSAIGARLVATRLIPSAKPQQAYTAALFHDVGKLVFSEFLSEQVTEPPPPEQITHFLRFEQSMFGIDHAAVSAEIALEWHLPDTLVQAVAYHHHPGSAPAAHRKTALAVHLGDMFAMMAGFGTQLDNMHYETDPMIDEYVTRDRTWEMQVLPELLLAIHEEYQTVISKFDHEEPSQ